MCTSSRSYQDILAPRRGEISNFMWVSRPLEPQIAYKQTKPPSPQLHKEQVLRSPKIQELVLQMSRTGAVSREALEAQVRCILDEIGYNKKTKLIRWLGLVLVKICMKICSGIYVNHEDVLQLKSSMGDCPVVFVPSHRSYADFILMSLMCFTEDLAIPAIAAGMDFHGMWGMGAMLRDTGAFFMRRSYNDDSLYWTTFKQYINQIVTKGELPLEFFIEGTRSRSNKSLMPKYGLILMVLKAYFLSQVPDILFVPINISYDRILEEKLFAFELLGIPKPKESTSGFFKSLSILKESFGSIYFDFAQPISVRDFFGPIDRSVHSTQPLHQQEITDEEKKLIPALAHEIVYKQQKHCVVTVFNLLAIVLNDSLTTRGSPLVLVEVAREIMWLMRVVKQLGAFVHSNDLQKEVVEALEVHRNLIRIDKEGRLDLVFNDVVVDESRLVSLKGHKLSNETISLTVPFIMLQIYVNPVLHYLVDVATLVTILGHCGKSLDRDELFRHYHFLRSLFSQEFVTFKSREKMEFESALGQALKLNLINSNNSFYQLGDNKKLQRILHQRTVDEKTIMSRVQETTEVEINRGEKFIHPYCLSLDSISNCLSSLASFRALKKQRNKSSILYEIDEPKVLSIRNEIELYMVPVLDSGSIQFHLKNKL